MILSLLLILFSALLFFVGGYLLKHRQKNFLFFKPESDALQSSLFQTFGIIFIVMGFASLTSLIMQNDIVISAVLFLTCMFILVFNLMIVRFFPNGK